MQQWAPALRQSDWIEWTAMAKQSSVLFVSIQKMVMTSITFVGILGATSLAMAPAVEANHHHHRNHHNRHHRRVENREIRRAIRHDRRDWDRYRRNYYSTGRYGGYLPLRPAYAYGYGYRNGYRYHNPSGIQVRIGFWSRSAPSLFRGSAHLSTHPLELCPVGVPRGLVRCSSCCNSSMTFA